MAHECAACWRCSGCQQIQHGDNHPHPGIPLGKCVTCWADSTDDDAAADLAYGEWLRMGFA